MFIVAYNHAVNLDAVKFLYIAKDRKSGCYNVNVELIDDNIEPWALGSYKKEEDAREALNAFLDAYENGEKLFRWTPGDSYELYLKGV